MSNRAGGVNETEPNDVDLVVRMIAQTAVDNEKYFCDLDGVVGDGDFGYSLARGFEKVLEDWDSIDRRTPGTFLKKIAVDHRRPGRRRVRHDLGHGVPAGRRRGAETRRRSRRTT